MKEDIAIGLDTSAKKGLFSIFEISPAEEKKTPSNSAYLGQELVCRISAGLVVTAVVEVAKGSLDRPAEGSSEGSGDSSRMGGDKSVREGETWRTRGELRSLVGL